MWAPEDAGKGNPVLETGGRAFTMDGIAEVAKGPWRTAVQHAVQSRASRRDKVAFCYLAMQTNDASDELQEHSGAVLAQCPN